MVSFWGAWETSGLIEEPFGLIFGTLGFLGARFGDLGGSHLGSL